MSGKFASKYGISSDEALADGCFHWSSKYHRFDPNIARLTTWTYLTVWRGLLTDLQQQKRDRVKLDNPVITVVQARAGFSLERFLLLLSDDGREVASAVIIPPYGVEEVLRERYPNMTWEPTNKARYLRSGVIEYLLQQGWTIHRIARAFVEIGEALEWCD